MVTASCVGSASAASCPRQLPPHWANRMSARHSSADRPSLMMESISRNHTRYFTSSAPTSAMQNVVPSHLSDVNLFDFKGITHGSEVVDGGDLAFDREDIPLQPAGWQPDEEDARLDELRLNVVEVK